MLPLYSYLSYLHVHSKDMHMLSYYRSLLQLDCALLFFCCNKMYQLSQKNKVKVALSQRLLLLHVSLSFFPKILIHLFIHLFILSSILFVPHMLLFFLFCCFCFKSFTGSGCLSSAEPKVYLGIPFPCVTVNLD